jgi:hypothetical protein
MEFFLVTRVALVEQTVLLRASDEEHAETRARNFEEHRVEFSQELEVEEVVEVQSE